MEPGGFSAANWLRKDVLNDFLKIFLNFSFFHTLLVVLIHMYTYFHINEKGLIIKMVYTF